MKPVATLSRALHRRLVDGLYVEAMVMADEARAYFSIPGEADRDMLDVMTRVSFSCESLKVTTRLMHVIAWLLTQRAWQRGEIDDIALCDSQHRLGAAAPTDPALLQRFPFTARALMEASEDLYDRVARLEQRLGFSDTVPADVVPSPARALIERIERAF